MHAHKNASSILLPDGVDTLACQGEGFGGFLIHMGEDLDNELAWDDFHWRWSLSGESLPTALTIMSPSLPMRQYMLLIHLRGFATFPGGFRYNKACLWERQRYDSSTREIIVNL